MPNACLLCLKSSISHPGLSLHEFPTNTELCNDWLNACGLSKDDYGLNRKICSRHFEENCFTEDIKRYLKPNSIPTLHLKCNKQLTCTIIPEPLNENISIDSCGVSVVEPECALSTNSTDAPVLEPECALLTDSSDESELESEFAYTSSGSSDVTFKEVDGVMVPKNNKWMAHMIESDSSDSIDSSDELPKSKKKKLFDTFQNFILKTPIKDSKSRAIKTPGLNTSQRMKKIKEKFKRAKRQALSHRKEIRFLYQKVKRLEARLLCIDNVIEVLKKKKFIKI